MRNARAVHMKGVTFLGISDSRHWIPMDGPAEFGGSDAGIRPKELILVGLAGCTGSDVASMLNKMRVPYTRFEVDIEAEMAEEHPKVYTKIEVIYRFWGEDLDSTKLARAIQLSEETYCSVTAMLKPSVEMSSRYEINPEEKTFAPPA